MARLLLKALDASVSRLFRPSMMAPPWLSPAVSDETALLTSTTLPLIVIALDGPA